MSVKNLYSDTQREALNQYIDFMDAFFQLQKLRKEVGGLDGFLLGNGLTSLNNSEKYFENFPIVSEQGFDHLIDFHKELENKYLEESKKCAKNGWFEDSKDLMRMVGVERLEIFRLEKIKDEYYGS